MWFYSNVTREEFERRKDRVEEIMLELGAEKIDIELPYKRRKVSCFGGDIERSVFIYENGYFRVEERLFPAKPFIVLEYGTLEELMNNTMEDVDPFPFDLNDDEMRKEVGCSMGIKNYDELSEE